MKRRNLLLTAAAATVGVPFVASRAQQGGGITEGTHYVRLAQPVAAAGGGKIDVVEFFWYGCPHCNAFEPALEAWLKKIPDDVAFRRVPVAFREEPFVAHQKIYYALEAIGALEAMHRKVFYAIHVERQRLDKPADIQAFVAKNGVDGAKFLEAYNSFGVQTKVRQAKLLSEQYRIDGVPAMGIQGRFWTSAGLVGTERMLQVTDALIQQARKA